MKNKLNVAKREIKPPASAELAKVEPGPAIRFDSFLHTKSSKANLNESANLENQRKSASTLDSIASCLGLESFKVANNASYVSTNWVQYSRKTSKRASNLFLFSEFITPAALSNYAALASETAK
ncbi:hypothetical protein EVAR_38171_1 [Eumeta japonica]|uniref:Uncharacterized protein n=1 Tax=Eumeta variegata TaxID=151549 RepID=A0A4C1WEA9_EUMVA|nr:hypothetical protein EVAR_38171_1 [Eumeta japonica]